MCVKRSTFRRGMTLMEALLASTLLAMGASAIVLPFTTAAQNEEADARRTLAVHLAQEMIEEILSKPFDDPQGGGAVGPEGDETSRGLYDNIDDYNGYAEGYDQALNSIVGLTGQSISEPAAEYLSRHVATTYVYVAGQDSGDDPSFIRIDVTVKHKNNKMLSLTRMVYLPR